MPQFTVNPHRFDPYKDFIAPGLIASAAMWSSAFETTYNVYFRMNELRLYDNVLSTPVEVQDLVAGDLAWSASRARSSADGRMAPQWCERCTSSLKAWITRVPSG